ncbi:hypothetical protein FXO37_05856 [Capsicum annuum]|nr:hypothetical protein FXO37_05856 [Capsicum annuum]
MTSSLGTHPRICSLGGPEHILKERSCKISCFRYTDVESSWKESFPLKGQKFNSCRHLNTRKCWSIFSAAIGDANDPDGSEDNKNPPENETGSVNSEILRGNLERIVGRDDSGFSGIDLAALIRNKYGRSYDVQLIKKSHRLEMSYDLPNHFMESLIKRKRQDRGDFDFRWPLRPKYMSCNEVVRR